MELKKVGPPLQWRKLMRCVAFLQKLVIKSDSRRRITKKRSLYETDAVILLKRKLLISWVRRRMSKSYFAFPCRKKERPRRTSSGWTLSGVMYKVTCAPYFQIFLGFKNASLRKSKMDVLHSVENYLLCYQILRSSAAGYRWCAKQVIGFACEMLAAFERE